MQALEIFTNNTSPSSNNTKCHVKLTFLNNDCQECDLVTTFEKEGITDPFSHFTLMEELSVAIRQTVEKYFKQNLIASNCKFQYENGGEIKTSSEWSSPMIYNDELYQKYKVD